MSGYPATITHAFQQVDVKPQNITWLLFQDVVIIIKTKTRLHESVYVSFGSCRVQEDKQQHQTSQAVPKQSLGHTGVRALDAPVSLLLLWQRSPDGTVKHAKIQLIKIDSNFFFFNEQQFDLKENAIVSL